MFSVATLSLAAALGVAAAGTETGSFTAPLAVSLGGTGLTSTSQNFAFIGPTSGSGAPTWRALVAGDGPWSTGTAIYGDGSDGVATFDGSTTVAGMAPSSNVYTCTRDYFFTSATVSAGVTVKTANFIICGTGTLTINSTGIVQNDGPAGASNVAGTALSTGTLVKGANGGTGGAVTPAVGQAGSATTFSGGGAGGHGGTGTSAGGAAGTITTPPQTSGGLRSFSVLQGRTSGSAPSAITGGGGGGGGGGATTGTGGGGGAGAGGMVLAFKSISNSGAIHCTGGAGGNGTGVTAGAGAGGGGGFIGYVYNTYTGSVPTAAAGASGTGGATGLTNGGTGSVVALAQAQ